VPKTVTVDPTTIGDILFASFCAHLSIAVLGGSTLCYPSASRGASTGVAHAEAPHSDAVEEAFRPEFGAPGKH
jgi:hypothetical protein